MTKNVCHLLERTSNCDLQQGKLNVRETLKEETLKETAEGLQSQLILY